MNEIVKWMPDWFFLLILSILIGGIVGLEQESYHRKIEEKHFGGIRTFPLISLLGFSSEYFLRSPVIVAIIFTCFSLMIVGEYLYEAFYFNRKGITTEIAGLFTFVIGVILAKGYVIEAVSLSIIITLILSLREFLHGFVEKYIYKKDISAILKFLVVSAVLYPILPDKSFTFLKLNPRSIWLMVVLISSISFAAYFATKLLGSKKGILITALFGGLMSSTAVTLAFSKRSKEAPELSCELALGVILASSIMFIRQLIVMFIIYPSISYKFAFFSIIAFLVGLAFALKRHKSGNEVVEVEFSNPYDLTHALFFGAFYTVVLILSRLAHTYLGSKGIYLLGFVSGFADVDPLTISMSQLSKTGIININVALVSIIISSITNTLIKGVYATMFGHKNMRGLIWKAFIAMSIISVGIVLGVKFM
ncbi:MgtC/SapB family protein [Hippea maritima]|uniref:Putative Mg2+ transporter-C family protein n=1 Tax=Hippea maritima (strain ATCC 700847 / DSM 10411 / MH2) TaxID=760142 RepID=F2LY52_HIPMA|nr:MgtC/SapB family protein [Hippea maritima]AEA34375.1 putative Mg2+ transporter-C family protein [Hippea maritima DSM 10411]